MGVMVGVPVWTVAATRGAVKCSKLVATFGIIMPLTNRLQVSKMCLYECQMWLAVHVCVGNRDG